MRRSHLYKGLHHRRKVIRVLSGLKNNRYLRVWPRSGGYARPPRSCTACRITNVTWVNLKPFFPSKTLHLYPRVTHVAPLGSAQSRDPPFTKTTSELAEADEELPLPEAVEETVASSPRRCNGSNLHKIARAGIAAERSQSVRTERKLCKALESRLYYLAAQDTGWDVSNSTTTIKVAA